MSGDTGGFVPKGTVRLRDAIEKIGKATVPGWTGDEQKAENWENIPGKEAIGKEWMYRVWLP